MYFSAILFSIIFVFLTISQTCSHSHLKKARRNPQFKTNLSKKTIIDTLSKFSYFFATPRYLRTSQHRHAKDLAFADLTRDIDWEESNEDAYRRPLSQLGFHEIIALLRKLSHPLRLGSFTDRSREEDDPLAPGHHHSSESSDNSSEKAGIVMKPWPHYTWYDFWTYKKHYITGECPGQLIKVDGVCIETPPHR